MGDVALPAQIEGVGEALVIAFFEVGIVALLMELAFALLVGILVRVRIAVGRRGWGTRQRGRFALFGSGHAGEGVCVYFAELVADAQSPVRLRVHVVSIAELGLHAIADRRKIARLLQAFDRRLAPGSKPNMPRGEARQDNADDAREHGQEDVVDGHEGIRDLGILQNLSPHPRRRGRKTEPTKEGRVDEEQEEGFVVAEADAGSQPRAVVVHLQHAALACRAVMGAVGFLGLALFAEAKVAGRGFDGEGRVGVVALLLGRQVGVAVDGGQRRAWVGEDGGGVAPVEQEVERDAEEGGEFACAGGSAAAATASATAAGMGRWVSIFFVVLSSVLVLVFYGCVCV